MAAALTVILMIAVSSMFITSINSATRTHARQVIKSEGSYALNQIGFFLRNAISLGACTANSITMTNVDGGTSNFHLVGTAIASGSATLTSGSVKASNLAFTCTTSATTGEKYVTVGFYLSNLGTGTTIGQAFSSVILMRN